MDHVVKLSDGLIQGCGKTDLNGVPFHSFLCIPYGKPVVGDLRFKAPQPIEPWQGIKDTTKDGKSSFQINMETKQCSGGDDCLNLHVFTKKLPEEENRLKPVMVFVHGGGFVVGNHDTSTYGPDYLMTEDIVLVSITYRVGLLGFLHLNDSSLNVPGNAGLKDQVLALKWVQRNIKSFNGDPNNVTLFGSSAGAASVEFLILSPTAKDLFHRAITQSGSVLNPWTKGYFDSIDFATYMGKPDLTEKELLTELTDMPFEKLCELQHDYIKSKNFPGNFGLLAPVKEKPNPSAFLTEDPIDIIQSGEYNCVPVIIGYTENEGALFTILREIGRTLNPNMKPFDPSELDMKKLLPYETDFNNDQTVTNMIEILEKNYLNEHHNSNIELLMTDAYFVNGIITSAKQHAKASNHPVYLYRFTMDTKLNWIKNMAPSLQCKGACHADEIGYLFKNIDHKDIGEIEKEGRRKMLSLWTNFAKFGNPTPENNNLNITWKPIENDEINYLDIGMDLKMDVNPEEDRMKIWHELYKCDPSTIKYI